MARLSHRQGRVAVFGAGRFGTWTIRPFGCPVWKSLSRVVVLGQSSHTQMVGWSWLILVSCWYFSQETDRPMKRIGHVTASSAQAIRKKDSKAKGSGQPRGHCEVQFKSLLGAKGCLSVTSSLFHTLLLSAHPTPNATSALRVHVALVLVERPAVEVVQAFGILWKK